MTHDLIIALFSHILLFLTTIAGFVFQWMREGRRREWHREQFTTLRQEIHNGKEARVADLRQSGECSSEDSH
jgi:hypothetical protein